MKIQVCMWNWCKKRYSEYILKRLENDVERFDMNNVNLSTCACCWKCEEWPVVKFAKRTESEVSISSVKTLMQNMGCFGVYESYILMERMG